MNKPPGYYRDERGREYYWDGRQRSYIPENSFSQFMTDMNTMTLWIVGVLVFIPVAIGLIALVIWALVASPLVLLMLLAIGFGVYAMVTYYMKQEAEEKRVKAQKRAEADKRRERERREEAASRRKESEAKAEAKRRLIKETEAAISGYLTEGIRQDFVGKTQDDLLPPEDHPFDEVYAEMTEEERIRHVNYISANTTLKGLKPTAFMDPLQRERYTDAQAAFAALGYRAEEVEKALNDVPPQDSVEKYLKEALRRIGSRR